MKNILFLTDFSEAANAAKNACLSICEQTNSNLHALHALDAVNKYMTMALSSSGDPMVPGLEPQMMLKIVEQHKDQAQKEMDKLKLEFDSFGLQIETFVSSNDMLDDVNDYCTNKHIDMIVMGTHGSSGFKEAFVGSNAQRIVRYAKVPVLTIRHDVVPFKVEKMLFASNFKEDAINKELPRIKEMADLFNAKLNLVYINTPAYFENTPKSEKRIKEVLLSYRLDQNDLKIFNDYSIEDGIIHCGEEQKADVLVLVTHGYSGIKKWLSDDVTETVVNHSAIPVLSFHIRD
jgi:nucleotide-binding universal stress UspA family protein